MSRLLRCLSSPAVRFSRAFARLFSAKSDDISDRCDRHIVASPFSQIPEGPFLPLYEFVSQHWKSHVFDLDKVAILDGTTGLTRTFRGYCTTSTSLAAALLYDLNVVPDSAVALFCPNHVDYAPIVLAVSLCGARVTPINPLFTTMELERVLERSRSSVLIAHISTLDIALESAKNSKYLKHVIVVTDDGETIPSGTIALDDLRSHDKAFDTTVDDVHEHTPASLPYSSGTTGLPKGVCLTHRNLVSNLLQFGAIEGPHFGRDDTLISPLPFFHIYAFTVSLLCPAWQGQTVVTMSGRFQLEEYCKLVETHKPTRSHLVPPILLGLAQHPVVDRYDMSSLKVIVSAAAPLSVETEQAVEKRIGCLVKQGWGMSELSPIGTFTPDSKPKSGSVGPLVGSTLAKIIDDKGNSLPPHEPGELLLKGPQVMLGYMDDPVKTRECLSESGWLRTGDVAHYDEDGYFYITDRIKELIKCRGYPVAPAELESLLLTHDAVQDVAVIQVPDEVSGELPRAYVVLKEHHAATAEGLYEWTKDRVAPYKRLDGGIVFTDSIPKSASGKILRRILRDQIKAELGQTS